MCKAILATLEKAMGDQWTSDTARAWEELWDAAMSTMSKASLRKPNTLLISHNHHMSFSEFGYIKAHSKALGEILLRIMELYLPTHS